MNLVLFDDALEHLTRIHRVIRMDQGHALLVGVGGSGKQSLTRLASFTAGCEVFEITLTRGYSENDFREDLKTLYQKLGMENKKVVFLFTDAHVAQEGKLFNVFLDHFILRLFSTLGYSRKYSHPPPPMDDTELGTQKFEDFQKGQ